MKSLLNDARNLLEAAGYSTHAPHPASSFLLFEDVSIVGRLQVLRSTSEVLSTWTSIQDGFVTEHAGALARDMTKTWNLYLVLLTSEVPDADVAAKLSMIDDDFRSARKLVRAGVVTQEDLARALAPILPLRNLLELDAVDVGEQLRARLDATHPAMGSIIDDIDVEHVAAAILGSQ